MNELLTDPPPRGPIVADPFASVRGRAYEDRTEYGKRLAWEAWMRDNRDACGQYAAILLDTIDGLRAELVERNIGWIDSREYAPTSGETAYVMGWRNDDPRNGRFVGRGCYHRGLWRDIDAEGFVFWPPTHILPFDAKAKDESESRGTEADECGYDVLPAEAVTAFAGWLSCRTQALTAGSGHDCAALAEAVQAYRLAQGWEPPRDDYMRRIRPAPCDPEAQAKELAAQSPCDCPQPCTADVMARELRDALSLPESADRSAAIAEIVGALCQYTKPD